VSLLRDKLSFFQEFTINKTTAAIVTAKALKFSREGGKIIFHK
jgi:hypothetical protein